MAVLNIQPKQRKKIGDILLSKGYISQGQVDYIVSLKAQGNRERFGYLCMKEGFISDAQLAEALAEQLNLEYIDLSKFEPDDSLILSVPLDLMHRYQFIPYHRKDGELFIAVSDPTNVVGIDEVRVMLDTPIRVVVGAAGEVQDVLKRMKGAERVLKGVSEDFKFQLIKETDEGDVGVSVSHCLQSHLHQPDHGNKGSQVP